MDPLDSESSSLPLAVIKLATDMFARDYGLSGPKLHDAFAPFTDVLGYYPMHDKPSRWMIFERGMRALDESQQRQLLQGLLDQGAAPDDDRADRLRVLLVPGISVALGQMEEKLAGVPDWEAVRRDWERTVAAIPEDPEAAIRAARTTLESVCKHICDERGAVYQDSDDLAKLYKTAARALTISPDQHSEQIIKQILSGASSIVSGLAGLRNALSDAHGKGLSSPRPGPRHARLAVNAAFAVAIFLIDTHVEKP